MIDEYPIPDENGFLFVVPDRNVWEEFCVLMDNERIPEEEYDLQFSFRKV